MNPTLLNNYEIGSFKKSGVNPRIQSIYAGLEKEGLDGLLISSSPNISYLTKFASRDSYLLVSKKRNIYFTDSRYAEEAKSGLKRIAAIQKINGSFFKIIAKACIALGLRNIGFEERYLPFAEYEKIKKELNQAANLKPTHSLIEDSRQVKTKEELGKIKKAITITIEALRFIEDFILPGKKEIEIAAELERFIRYRGASNNAFDIIVASGPNSSFPHHITSRRIIKNNEPVLIDIGVDYLGYKSDLTRVFFLGKINSLVRMTYGLVKKAQDRAISQIKPGVIINKIDRAARQYITQNGYGGFFGHNTGHGVGLEVHEAPYVSGKNEDKLKPGMVFTVEPGIYLPNKFGIRIEDMVLVTAKGAKVLSGSFNK